ncbi:Carboxylate-amine ligase YbdK [Corynebacterium kalinowskii]|uniref:Putative glutamate--cysteine ligase 2 n=1 Tax=Corynebacterium kalinowskii TaxID=2675216 RepID=A0A6B8W0G0_9CORY|nr:glutamate--cysteine ligase [Corynebacterium kalinowskii]QGU01228.1 Carboxylate-amine ligase YbdK [Corynebacterium kalinowskii]
MTDAFAQTQNHTLGVEWEIALIDPETRDLVPLAEQVIADLAEQELPVRVEKEFLANTVELVTGVCATVGEAIGQLSAGLEAVEKAAAVRGARAWASGSHPFASSSDQIISDKSHYNEILERTKYWGQQMLIWGVHIHVGIDTADRVWPVINAMMTKYPHLLALSASSPGWDGKDTGYASNRTMLYQQLPTAGIPYDFKNWEEYSSFIADQKKSGVIDHDGSMHLDIRPAEKWGTIEVRFSDAPTNLRELAAIVALTHCLIVYYDSLFEAGESLPSLQQWHNTENKWRAARYGMDAIIITSRDTDEVPVTEDLELLLDVLRPFAEQLGCAAELELVREIMDGKAAYQRQRERFEETDDWKAVVDLACDELETLRP